MTLSTITTICTCIQATLNLMVHAEWPMPYLCVMEVAAPYDTSSDTSFLSISATTCGTGGTVTMGSNTLLGLLVTTETQQRQWMSMQSLSRITSLQARSWEYHRFLGDKNHFNSIQYKRSSLTEAGRGGELDADLYRHRLPRIRASVQTYRRSSKTKRPPSCTMLGNLSHVECSLVPRTGRLASRI